MNRQPAGMPRKAPSAALHDRAGAPEKNKSILREYVQPILAIVLVAILVRGFVIHAYRIPSGSMEDTLLVGDFLLANRFVYGAPIEIPFTGMVLGRLPALSEPKRGDVLIFASWEDTTEDYIKRLVGLPGDTILVQNNVLTVNGRDFNDILDERFGADSRVFPRIKDGMPDHPLVLGYGGDEWDPANFGPYVVPAKHLFMMGDNRNNSADSRKNGPVPMRRVKARAMIIYFSLNSDRLWTDLGGIVRWNRIGRIIH